MARFCAGILLLILTVTQLAPAIPVDLLTPNVIIPSSYFGLHIHHLDYPSPTTPWPSMPIPEWRLWDAAVKGKNIHLHNNLTLASPQADMVFIDSGGDPAKVRGPGDGALLLKNWYLSHNWRETKPPTGTSYLEKSWIPPGPQDVCRDDIPVLSRNPEEANFLRPAKDSPLAKAGAGRDLPTYVGAVPPEGVQAWDWQKTWNARMRKFPEKKGKTGKE